MKKAVVIFTFLIFSILAVNFTAHGQGRTPEIQIQRDPVLEQDQLRNLNVARQYFTTKKAYKAVLMRCDEIIAAYPEFSRMDEVLYLVGMSSLYLSEGKGSQKINLATEKDKERFDLKKLREDAVANLSLLVEKFPTSEFKPRAEKTLKQIDQK